VGEQAMTIGRILALDCKVMMVVSGMDLIGLSSGVCAFWIVIVICQDADATRELRVIGNYSAHWEIKHG
jgi:hypothetical protein